MKKILVFDDWEKFWRELHGCGYKWRDITWQEAEKYYDGNVSIDTVEKLLKPYEQDVIEFEGVVEEYEVGPGLIRSHILASPFPEQLNDGDSLRLYAVKQKKKAEDEPR